MVPCQFTLDDTEDTGGGEEVVSNRPANMRNQGKPPGTRACSTGGGGLTRVGDVPAAVRRGRGLVAQALLGASVVVVVVRGLPLSGVAMVPASQVLGHHLLLDGVLVGAWRRAAPGWPQRGVRVLGHAVQLVGAVVAVVRRGHVAVRGIEAVVSLHLIVVHVVSVGVRLRLLVSAVARHAVGRCGGSAPRLGGVATGIRLSQVGHAARVGVHVPVASASPAPVRGVAGDAVLGAGVARVGGAVVEDLGAVAASGRGHGERWHGGSGLCGELRLGLQTAAALAEELRLILQSSKKHI